MHPCLALIDNIGQLIAVICVIGGLSIGIVVSTAALYFHHKRRQLWHETARLALEKGQPLPALPDAPVPGNPSSSRNNDIRSGLILIAVGAGLILFFFNSWLRYVGAIPGFIGVALFLYGVFSARSGRPNQSADRPPQS